MIREVSKLEKKNVEACVNIMEDFYSSLIQLAQANWLAYFVHINYLTLYNSYEYCLTKLLK